MPIIVKGLNYVYNAGTPFEKRALVDVNLKVETGEFLCIIGHTGSGKSTFIQHLNGLIRVQSGSIIVDDIDLSEKKPDLKTLRTKVGMVFQYPEYQLFADTVYKDVAFGPMNLKLSVKETDDRVMEALSLVGLNPELFKDKSPFELSGGEKRRAAIAGVIAMRPSVLVLDEPTAGLDPRGKREILNLIIKLKKESCPTIIMINHDMNEVAEYATNVAVFCDGTIKKCDCPQKLFNEQEFLANAGLELPKMAIIKHMLIEKGFNVNDDCLTVDKMFDEIIRLKKEKDAMTGQSRLKREGKNV
ncbi:MAG: energy-coupling factor transporter ATPase [Clostridia bacterium]